MPLALAALALSCAAPAELARRSETALAGGDTRLAFDWAERAMKADPSLPRARTAMIAAAGPASADWQQRVRALAAADSVGGARLSLDFAAVRAKVGGWNLEMPLDSAYIDDESQIRRGGAAALYARGQAALREHRPRDAWREFTGANEIVPGYRDVDERIRRSFELGIVRIAILPFDDDIGVPGLATELAGDMRRQIAANMPEKKYPFVRFVPDDAIARRLNGGEAVTRDEAIRIGRDAGAQRVVWGRYHGLSTETRTDSWHDRVFRKVSERDSGRTHVRFDEVRFETVRREREVSVAWEFEVIETDEEQALGRRQGTEHVTARTVFTTFEPNGSCDDYSFAPPDWKSSKSSEWKSAESAWVQRFGDWTVPHLLEAARDSHNHPRYRPQDRKRFASYSRPVVMDDLPPPDDLAFLALRETANQVWDVLKALERTPKARP